MTITNRHLVSDNARSRSWVIGKGALILGAFVLILGAFGCATPRLTTEVVWPAVAEHPPEIVVIWPEGVEVDSVWTGEANGRTVSVAPMP
ncbi:hypothetical protein HQ520_14585 [bacterium]|nr:hypothetical protein [bacterium]